MSEMSFSTALLDVAMVLGLNIPQKGCNNPNVDQFRYIFRSFLGLNLRPH